MTHICVSELAISGSDNGLSSPGRRQAIIWNNAGLFLIEPLGTNFSEISIAIQTFSFKKMHLNMSCSKWRPFCLGLNVLNCLWASDYVITKSCLTLLLMESFNNILFVYTWQNDFRYTGSTWAYIFSSVKKQNPNHMQAYVIVFSSEYTNLPSASVATLKYGEMDRL